MGCLRQLQVKPNPPKCVDHKPSKRPISAALSFSDSDVGDVPCLCVFPGVQEPNPPVVVSPLLNCVLKNMLKS